MHRTWPQFALFVVLAAVAATASAQSFPAKPVRLLVPFGPGGVGDITARAVAQKMGAALGQPVVIDNRPSAGGVIATELVAKAEPNGYTLLLLNNAHAISHTLFRKLPYDVAKDFAPVSTISTFSVVVLVAPDSPLKSLMELIAQAKSSPGKLTVGTIQVGSTQHLSAELFKSMAGIDVLNVPFTNTGALLTALRGNQVQAAFEIMAPVVGQLRGGGLRALAVTPPTRFPGLPDIPTVAEAGVAGYQVTSWNGVAAPVRTPKAVIDRLHQVIAEAVASPDIKQRFQELGVEAQSAAPEEFRKLLVSEIAKWDRVIENARIPRQ
jgi:tripartite-type tricarboxylate transporter receptor subunit TctC